MRPGSVFICYRRSDMEFAEARQVVIEKLHGEKTVFRDLSTIEPGEPFPDRLEQALDAARLVLVVMGPGWLERIRKPRGTEPDYVRHELAGAARRKVRVVPLLIKATKMPAESDLPDEVRFLAKLHAVPVPDDGNLNAHIRLLDQPLRKTTDLAVLRLLIAAGSATALAFLVARAIPSQRHPFMVQFTPESQQSLDPSEERPTVEVGCTPKLTYCLELDDGNHVDLPRNGLALGGRDTKAARGPAVVGNSRPRALYKRIGLAQAEELKRCSDGVIRCTQGECTVDVTSCL